MRGDELVVIEKQGVLAESVFSLMSSE